MARALQRGPWRIGVRPTGTAAGTPRYGRRGRYDSATFSLRLRLQYKSRCECVLELVILDVVEVTIGDKTQIGPGVQILTADHPRDAAKRASGLEFGRPIRIGGNVWIGGGA